MYSSLRICSIAFILVVFQVLFSGMAPALSTPPEATVPTINEGVTLRFSGTIQPRVTYGSQNEKERVGFGLRRMRFRGTALMGDHLGMFLQLEGSGSSAALLDVRGEYYLNNVLTLRVGRFVGTQPRSFARTLHSEIDAVDRPSIAVKWAGMTIGADGRDYGVEAVWNRPHREVRLYVHNGYNQWNYRSEVVSEPVTGGLSTDGMALSASVTHWPDGRDRLALGAYAGVNSSGNPLTSIPVETAPGVTVLQGRSYATYSAHAYWGSLPGQQPVRVKADVIGVVYEELSSIGSERFTGGSLLGAWLASPEMELFARGEYWHAGNGNNEATARMFLTAGGSYSLSAKEDRPFSHNRLILAYSLKTRELATVSFSDAAHVITLQAQFYF